MLGILFKFSLKIDILGNAVPSFWLPRCSNPLIPELLEGPSSPMAKSPVPDISTHCITLWNGFFGWSLNPWLWKCKCSAGVSVSETLVAAAEDVWHHNFWSHPVGGKATNSLSSAKIQSNWEMITDTGSAVDTLQMSLTSAGIYIHPLADGKPQFWRKKKKSMGWVYSKVAKTRTSSGLFVI